MKIDLGFRIGIVVFSLTTLFAAQANKSASLVSAPGCSKVGVRFHYTLSGSTSNWIGRCDSNLRINSALLSFINHNFLSCVNSALVGKQHKDVLILHAGIAGDSRHESTSWHSELLAIDLKGIVVGGVAYKYADRAQSAVFEKLRNCWAERVILRSKKGQRCNETNEGYPAGTIGREDPNHTQHLHLSLPCDLDRVRSKPSFDDMDWS